jgi:hypothetical protein
MGRGKAKIKAKTRTPMRAEEGEFVPQEGMQPGNAARAFASMIAGMMSMPVPQNGWQRGSRSAKLQQALKDAAATKRARRRMLHQLAVAGAGAGVAG